MHWWIDNAPHCNGRPIPAPTADLVITSDASKTGWGTTCQGIHTGGPWGAQERAEHINLLELKAAFLALQTFASRRSRLHILLLIDNITVIAYINHKGGTQSRTLSDQAIELWEWCLVRKITVHAEHIPGQKNVEADAESRRALDQSDWMLNQEIFQALETKWGLFDVDLFAARHNKQLRRFFSFRPDPEAEAVDALAQPWTNIRPYAFPLFILLGRCLQKIRQEGVQEIVIIAPVWQGQPWFPPLIESLIDLPALLPQTHNLLTNPAGDPHPLVVRNRLYLAAWRLSWSAVQNQGISREAFQIICSSWRRGTEKAYSSTWGKWNRWCSQRQTDPFPRSIGPIIEFLTMKFKEGMQYSTRNSYRSALSATLPPIEGHPVGQHPLVCRLLQGMFNQRPPAPRYQSVWNVGVVTGHIQSQLQLTDLPLKELSKRLVVLLALSNASRSSDLHALDLRFRQFTPEGVIFRIPGLTKTRRSGPPKEAFFAKFTDDEALCPVETLKVYKEKTTMLRTVDPMGPAPLLISF